MQLKWQRTGTLKLQKGHLSTIKLHILFFLFFWSQIIAFFFFQCSSMGFGYFRFRAPWCCVNDGFLFWCELLVESSSRCLAFSGVFPMHFHTGTEDQCPEAHYIPLTHENVCVDVFVWCVYVSPAPFYPPTNPHTSRFFTRPHH